MIRAWLAAAGLGGFLSVAAGAAGAHLAAGSRAADLLHTGAIYGMVHAAALVGVAAIAERRERPTIALRIAGWAFAVGLLLFSLSIDALAATGLPRSGWQRRSAASRCSPAGPHSASRRRSAVRRAPPHSAAPSSIPGLC
jgi:uncharacterized membrane protein YgdD (TMEM256/DUF423 family)